MLFDCRFGGCGKLTIGQQFQFRTNPLFLLQVILFSFQTILFFTLGFCIDLPLQFKFIKLLGCFALLELLLSDVPEKIGGPPVQLLSFGRPLRSTGRRRRLKAKKLLLLSLQGVFSLSLLLNLAH